MATTFQTGEVDGEAYRHDGVFLSKRPEVWPSCELDEVSDDEKAPPNVLFCMEARVKIITMDSLQKSSALLAGNIQSSMF